MKKYILFVFVVGSLYAQTLKDTIGEVISTNPIILERLKNYNAIKEDIAGAKAGYYPKIDLNLGAGREHTDKKDQPNILDSTYNYNVYQNSLKYTQNLFNGFSTTYMVKEQEYRTVSAAYSYIEKVNSTSYDTLNQYLQVMKNYELLTTAKENVDIDQKILNKVNKLYDSGLTTLSEVHKIESSLALAKSNLVVQENTILDQEYSLQRVVGRILDPSKMSKPELRVKLPNTKEEALAFALRNNPSLLVSEYNIRLAQATQKESKSKFYPKIDIEISEAMNKNLSAVEGKDDKFRAMAYLSFNIFNGFSDQAAYQKSISKIHQEVQNKSVLRRKIIENLNQAWAANIKLEEQLKHLIDYRDFSEATLKLYVKEYDLGRRSLLDLLSSQNDFIRSKAQIISTQYSLLYAKYRILDAMGILVTSVMGDENIVYSKVGLNGAVAPANQDTLSIKYDADNDLIANDADICDNSLKGVMKNRYGCKFKSDYIAQVEKYGGFLFDGNELDKVSMKKLQDLLKQLKPYDFKKIRFVVISNAFDNSLNRKQLLKLSKSRMDVVRKILLKAGVNEKNIESVINSDDVPMFSQRDDVRNNRVDILVQKLK